jgi:hypothetical protein
MRGPITVTLETVVVNDDGLGNTTETPTSTEYDGVRFAPRSSAERTDPRQPAVLSGATLYRRDEFPATASSRIVIVDQHPLIDGTWQVDGDAGYWGRGVEVAIKRAG